MGKESSLQILLWAGGGQSTPSFYEVACEKCAFIQQIRQERFQKNNKEKAWRNNAFFSQNAQHSQRANACVKDSHSTM